MTDFEDDEVLEDETEEAATEDGAETDSTADGDAEPLEAAADAQSVIEVAVAGPRVFRIGTSTVTEDTSTAGLSDEEARKVLSLLYPEVSNATIQRKTLENGQIEVSLLPQAGRKG